MTSFSKNRVSIIAQYAVRAARVRLNKDLKKIDTHDFHVNL